MCCFFTIYAVNIPANTQIYIGQFRNLIQLDVISPENILKKIDPNFDVNKFMAEQQTRLTAAEQASGFESKDFYVNM